MLLKGANPTLMDEKDKHVQKKAPRVKMFCFCLLTLYQLCIFCKDKKQTNKTLIQQRMLLRHFHKVLQDKMLLFGFLKISQPE